MRAKNVKGFNDMPPRGKEGAIRKRTSANAPPLAAHCPSFCAATLGRFLALSACLRACACSRVRATRQRALARLVLTSTRTTVKQPFWSKNQVKTDSLFQPLFYSKWREFIFGAERAAIAARRSDLFNINSHLSANQRNQLNFLCVFC